MARSQAHPRILTMALTTAALVGASLQASAMSCDDYASLAVQNFNTMKSNPKCRVPEDARWQGNYGVHFKWCQTASNEARGIEYKARVDHLVACGQMSTP